jgi:hypothetical protein
MAFYHRTILAALVLAAWLAAGAQNSQTNSQTEGPPATVEGAVINTQNSRTVPRASVTLMGLQGNGSKSTRADGNGRFIFENVQPGRYKLIAERQGFFSDGQKPAFQPAFQISAGQYLKGMPVRLIPTAVVAGEIVDEFNDPLQNVEVKLLATKMGLGQMYLAAAGKAVTDDRGQYRISGLHPGKYYVLAEYKPAASQADVVKAVVAEKILQPPPNRVAGPGPTEVLDAEAPEEKVEPSFTYPPIFFPETNDFRQAQAVRLKPGDEIPADFILMSTLVVSIRGRVTNGMTGDVASHPAISAFWSTYMEGDGIPAKLSKNGEFEVRGLAPGTYTVRASFTEDGQTYQGEESVVVGIRAVENVQIAAMPDFAAAGHVNITADITRQTKPIGHVSIEFAGEGLMPRVRSVASLPAMKFSVELRPDHRYHAIVRGLPEDYYLKSVSVFGHQMSPDNVVVSGATGEMEIELSPAGGHIDGVLLDSKGLPTRGSLLLVPDASDPGPSDLFRKVSVNDKGTFTIRGVTPGSYLAIGMQSSDLDTEINTPEFLSTVRNRGQSVIVDESGKYTITINLSNTETAD